MNALTKKWTQSKVLCRATAAIMMPLSSMKCLGSISDNDPQIQKLPETRKWKDLKICFLIGMWTISLWWGKEGNCQHPIYWFWKMLSESEYVQLGLRLWVLREWGIIWGNEPHSSSFQKYRDFSCDRACATALLLMEWADCRKTMMLLSKLNDFMKINVFLPRLLLVRIHLIPPFLWELNSCSTLQHINMFFSPHEIALQARNNVSASPCTFLLLPMNRSKLMIMANIIHRDKFLTHFTENNK